MIACYPGYYDMGTPGLPAQPIIIKSRDNDRDILYPLLLLALLGGDGFGF